MSWSELYFGKHIGKTIPQVMFSDPDWFFWAYENGAFKGAVKREADLIYVRATNIRIPQGDGKEELVAEYFFHQPTMKFANVLLVPKSRPNHQGSSATIRSEVLDLSIPRNNAKYDKFGCKLMIDAIKILVLKNGNVRMTKAKCEAFFDDLSRFTRPA